MRGDLGEHLRERERRKSQAFRAAVVSVNSDGSYQIRREDNGNEVKAQRGDISLSLTPGQIVTAQRTDLSGATVGTGYVITAPVTTNSLNSSNAARYVNQVRQVSETYSVFKVGSAFVTGITLTKGGAAVTLLIYGENLSTAPTYGDVGITDNVAAVITSTLITIQPKASGAMAVGLYSLTVAGVTIPNFIEVIA